MARVLLVDDEPHVIEALKDGLRGEPYEVVDAANAEEALAILARGDVDVLLTDDEMPGMRGSELVIVANRSHPDVVKIILTGKARLETVISAINEGQVYRFLVKPCPVEAVREVLRNALTQRALSAVSTRILEFTRGHTPVQGFPAIGDSPSQPIPLAPPSPAGSGGATLTVPIPDRDPLTRLTVANREALSPREKEILRAVLSGKRLSEVARTFFISIHTARNHLKTIYRKLDVHSRGELMGKMLAS